ncbi:MAG: hypothetical protein K6T61_01945 [Bryobacteraceae bacterium]|nr:hypothetical protein [Bryobacteraceae bacterium]
MRRPRAASIGGPGGDGCGHRTSLNALQRSEAPPAVKIPVSKLQARLSRVLQRVGGRQALSAG